MYFVNSATTCTIFDCVVKRNTATNKAGGVLGYSCGLTVENTVFAANAASVEGGAMYLADTWPSTVTNCTIAENDSPNGAGIRLVTATDLTVGNTIIAGNKGGAGLSLDPASSLLLECSDVFGNAGGDGLPAGVVDLGGNFSLDPQFCGLPATLNYELQGDSPCAPGNHPDGSPCALIGAEATTCGAVPVEKRTWGYIKSVYGDPLR
jgi:hypothetical protein